MNKIISKNLLKGKVCNECIHAFFNPATWEDYIKQWGAEPNEWCSFKSERPKENTCEEFKDDSGFYEEDINFDDIDYDDISTFEES